MTFKKQTLQQEDYIPNLAFDSVIFGFNGKKLKILILEYRNTGLFALPGGFIRRDENLDEAVKNGVSERTGLTDIYLEQFQTFGEANRADPEPMKRILEMNGLDPASHQWLLGRFVSVAYYALINFEKVVPKPDPLSDGIDWYALDELPPLMMDHKTIIEKALETVGLREPGEERILRIHNTLDLGELLVSEAYRAEVEAREDLSVVNEAAPMPFDTSGDLPLHF